MKINKKALLLGTMAFVLVAASGMVSAYASGSSGTKKAKVQTITEGVCIGSVDVGGMTKEEAKKAVDAYVDSIKDTSFSLKGANGSFDATAQEMSVSADTDAAADEALSVCHEGSLIDRFVESEELKKGNVAVKMYLSVDKQKTANMIYDKSDALNIKAVNNSLQRNGDSFDFVPGQEGKEVDVVKSVYAINDFLQNSWDGSANEIELVTNTVQPRGSKEELSKIKDNLGGFSTDFSSSAAGRAANVKNACSLINGSVIYPGEQFSVYEAISPITTDNGYQIAGAYENGQVVDSVGGGVCQVATTLYNAVIRAELEIVQRYNHSMIVNYVKPSDDAAIAGTYKDLKFKNNLNNPDIAVVESSPSMCTEWRRDRQTGKFHSGVRRFPRRIRLRSLSLMQVSRLAISTLSSLRTRDLQQGSGRRSQSMVQCRVMRYSTTASTSHHQKS